MFLHILLGYILIHGVNIFVKSCANWLSRAFSETLGAAIPQQLPCHEWEKCCHLGYPLFSHHSPYTHYFPKCIKQDFTAGSSVLFLNKNTCRHVSSKLFPYLLFSDMSNTHIPTGSVVTSEEYWCHSVSLQWSKLEKSKGQSEAASSFPG